MTDLMQSAQLLQTSSRFQSAAESLSALGDGSTVGESAADNLRWAGTFLRHVDWQSEVLPASSPQGSLALQATAARPTFYAAVVKLAPEFTREDIHSEDEVYRFLRSVYDVLTSGGSNASAVPGPHLKLGAKFLHMLSKSLLVQLSNNGLPKQRVRMTL